MRYHAHSTLARDMVYQGRFKSFSPFRMNSISRFSAVTSNATHSVPNCRARKRKWRLGVSCSVGSSRVKLCQTVVPHGVGPFGQRVFAVSNEELGDKELDAVRWSIRRGQSLDAKIGWSRSPVLDSNPHSGHAGRRKEPISGDQTKERSS